MSRHCWPLNKRVLSFPGGILYHCELLSAGLWACRQLWRGFSDKKLHCFNHCGATIYFSAPCSLVFLNCSISSSCQICVTESWLLFDVCRICSNTHCCFLGINNAVRVISHFIKELCHFSWSCQRRILVFQWCFFPSSVCFKYYWFSALLISLLLLCSGHFDVFLPTCFFLFSFVSHLRYWYGKPLLV